MKLLFVSGDNPPIMRAHKLLLYSITSSAREISAGGTVMPSDLAVFRLITNSNVVG